MQNPTSFDIKPKQVIHENIWNTPTVHIYNLDPLISLSGSPEESASHHIGRPNRRIPLASVLLYSYRSTSQINPKRTKPTDWMGRIWTAYLRCTRITLGTTALRVILTKRILKT